MQTIFLATHLGSDHESLSKALMTYKEINVYQTGQSYDHPSKIDFLHQEVHRCRNSKSIFVDTLLYNHSLTSSFLLKHYDFIYWFGDPKHVKINNYSQKQAEAYYSYRLAGLCEQYKKTAKAIFATSYDSSLLENYFTNGSFKSTLQGGFDFSNIFQDLVLPIRPELEPMFLSSS